MKRWRLLLTRSAPDCQQQANALQTLGISCECLPLLEIHPLAETPQQRSQLLDFDRYTALIVVSKPAAKLILERLDHYWPQLPIDQTWFTVGQATADILLAAGLTTFHPTIGDNSEALWQLSNFQNELTAPNTRVLIIKGQDGREWLKENLQLKAVAVETIELYQRNSPSYSEETLLKYITPEKINGLVISSGQALHNLHILAEKYKLQLNQMTFFVPSDRVATLAKELDITKVINCKGASLQALVSALENNS